MYAFLQDNTSEAALSINKDKITCFTNVSEDNVIIKKYN